MGWLGGIGEAFGDRNFRTYSLGSIGSWISFFIQLVAVSWLTWELTGSTVWLAAMALLDIVPNVVLMPLAGALADRYDRHRILLWTCVLSLGQALVLAVAAWSGVLTVWVLAGLVLFHGVVIAFMVPAMYGTLPRFVARERLTAAIAVQSSYTQLALFVGPALAGWILVEYGVAAAFFLNVLGYAILLLALLRLKTPEGYVQPKPEGSSLIRDILDGFRYVAAHRIFTALILLMLVADLVSAAFHYMLPAHAETVLKLGVAGMTVILAARGAGAILAALWIAYRRAGGISTDRILLGFFLGSVSLAILVHVTDVYLAALVAAIMGFGAELRKTGIHTLVQLTVAEEQRGRVMGLLFMVYQFASGIGAVAAGAAAAAFGLFLPLTVVTLIGLALWCVFFLRRHRLFGR